VGGAMSGNWVIGSDVMEINPSRRRMMEITVDSTGLSINLLSILNI
jgi:hypothetical protein